MNKKQLIARVRQLMGAGTTQATASAAAEAVLSSILAAAEDDKVHITRFGTFEYAERPARRCYDINTGQMRETKGTEKLAFRPAKGFVPQHKTPPGEGRR